MAHSSISDLSAHDPRLPRFLRNRRALVVVLIVVVSVLMAIDSLVLRYSDGGIYDSPSLGRAALLAAEPWVPWVLLALPLAWLFTSVTVLRGFSWRFVAVHLICASAVAATLVWGWDRITDPLLSSARQGAVMDTLRASMPAEVFEIWVRSAGEEMITLDMAGALEVEGFALEGIGVEGVEVESLDVEGLEPGDVAVFATMDEGPGDGVHYFSSRRVNFLPAFSTRILVYLVLLALSQGLLFYGEMHRGRAESALMRSRYDRMRLDSLRAHIDPHFLYNALTAISATIREDGETARAMIGDLSTLMRESSAREGGLCVTLDDELGIARAYVNLIQRRFRSRFEVVFDVADDARECEVPAWTLQPLLENVVVHGVQGTKQTVIARVRAFREGDELCIEVSDDAPGVSGVSEPSEHLGGTALENLRERLDALFGSAASLEAGPRPERGFLARIRVPRGGEEGTA
jgi:hypothetical protein